MKPYLTTIKMKPRKLSLKGSATVEFDNSNSKVNFSEYGEHCFSISYSEFDLIKKELDIQRRTIVDKIMDFFKKVVDAKKISITTIMLVFTVLAASAQNKKKPMLHNLGAIKWYYFYHVDTTNVYKNRVVYIWRDKNGNRKQLTIKNNTGFVTVHSCDVLNMHGNDFTKKGGEVEF